MAQNAHRCFVAALVEQFELPRRFKFIEKRKKRRENNRAEDTDAFGVRAIHDARCNGD